MIILMVETRSGVLRVSHQKGCMQGACFEEFKNNDDFALLPYLLVACTQRVPATIVIPLRWRQPTTVARVLIPGALPMIIAMGHLSCKNAQAVRKGKGKDGHCCSCTEKAMKGPDGRIDAWYPVTYTIREEKQ
jgi:hypothetical protein